MCIWYEHDYLPQLTSYDLASRHGHERVQVQHGRRVSHGFHFAHAVSGNLQFSWALHSLELQNTNF